MKQSLRLVFAFCLSFVVLAGTGTGLRADDTTGAGEDLSVEEVGGFISLMAESSDEAEGAVMNADGEPAEYENAPEAELDEASHFVAEQFELAQASPQQVTITDRAHEAINDELVLCLEMARDGEKSDLAFQSMEFCQGVGTNLMHRLALTNANGETVLTYTLGEFEE